MDDVAFGHEIETDAARRALATILLAQEPMPPSLDKETLMRIGDDFGAVLGITAETFETLGVVPSMAIGLIIHLAAANTDRDYVLAQLERLRD